MKKAWIAVTQAECPMHAATFMNLGFFLCETHAEALAQSVRAVCDAHAGCELAVSRSIAREIDPELVKAAASEMESR
jgi:hypothetical protein